MTNLRTRLVDIVGLVPGDQPEEAMRELTGTTPPSLGGLMTLIRSSITDIRDGAHEEKREVEKSVIGNRHRIVEFESKVGKDFIQKFLTNTNLTLRLQELGNSLEPDKTYSTGLTTTKDGHQQFRRVKRKSNNNSSIFEQDDSIIFEEIDSNPQTKKVDVKSFTVKNSKVVGVSCIHLQTDDTPNINSLSTLYGNINNTDGVTIRFTLTLSANSSSQVEEVFDEKERVVGDYLESLQKLLEGNPTRASHRNTIFTLINTLHGFQDLALNPDQLKK